MKNQLNWDDLRYFLHVARTGNLTQSSLELKVSQSTIARRIKALEDDLKTTLFTRHQTGYSLTEQAKGLTKYAEEAEAKIMRLQHTVSTFQTEIAGTVRLATAENIATGLLIPALPKLYKKHPGLTLEIITGVTSVGFQKHEADIALRTVRPEQENLLVRRVGKMSYGIFCHKEYPRHKEYPANPTVSEASLGQYHFITWDNAYAHLPSARWLARHLPQVKSVLATTSIVSQIAAVKAGIGAAILPHFLAASHHEFTPLAEHIFADDLWLVSFAELRTSPTIRAVIAFIVGELNQSMLRL